MAGKSIYDLKKLQKHQFNNITKAELIDAILSAGNDDATLMERQDQKLNRILEELTDIRSKMMEAENETKTKIKELNDIIEKQSSIIMQHQLFMEQVDRQKRETNLVMFGLPEEQVSLDGATTEDDKIQKVMNAVSAGPEVVVRSYRRLGQQQAGNRPRPLLVKVDSKYLRDSVLEKAATLKNMPEPYKKIYLKKDSHPEVRREWKRLKDAEEEEKRKPTNEGCNIRLDYRERVLYRDGVEIDRWRPHPF